MRIFLLASLTMIAFAANSLLNRAALADGTSGPAAFAAVRVISGAICLYVLVVLQRGSPVLFARRRLLGAGALAVYVLGFSFAYVALNAGIGALILFGLVQVTMFGGSLALGEKPAPRRWAGAGLALAGLAWLVWPGAVSAPPLWPVALMVAAGIGWGIYSLAGRGARDPLAETAANFIWAAPIALLVWVAVPDGLTASGAMLAVVSGAVTSGLGYALWYTVLPKLEATSAALAQLTVPVIAVLGGSLLLAEPVTFRIVAASTMILSGVAFGVLGQRRMGSKGS